MVSTRCFMNYHFPNDHQCFYFAANPARVAVPLGGPGGRLAILETARPGRLPDGVTPALINGATVLDFAFDPFDDARLIAACDDGGVRVWKLPQAGLDVPINDPKGDGGFLWDAHPGDKVQMVKFHPLAAGVVATAAAGDRVVKVWDLADTASGAMIELQVK